jgi:hypothetical protein
MNDDVRALNLDEIVAVSGGGKGNHDGTGPGTGHGDGLGWLRAIGGAVLDGISAVGQTHGR